jgi:cation diffusion facilitator family transporter
MPVLAESGALELRKQRAASLSVGYNVVATVVKLVGAGLTGSVSLLSEAAHSATDIVASLLAFFSVRAAAAPPDEEHPYGHGKIESVAGLAESILLVLIVAYIVIESVGRFAKPAPLPNVDLGLGIMAASAITSFIIGKYVQKVGVETRSMALQSNGQHLLVDCWTSVGVLVALVVVKVTGVAQADNWFAILFAGWMGFSAVQLSHKAYQDLIDRRVEDEEIALISKLIRETPGVVGFHQLRTRHSGATHYIDVHVVVPRTWNVVEAHDLADGLEKQIEQALAPAVAVIHIDPEPEDGLCDENPPD